MLKWKKNKSMTVCINNSPVLFQNQLTRSNNSIVHWFAMLNCDVISVCLFSLSLLLLVQPTFVVGVSLVFFMLYGLCLK